MTIELPANDIISIIQDTYPQTITIFGDKIVIVDWGSRYCFYKPTDSIEPIKKHLGGYVKYAESEKE